MGPSFDFNAHRIANLPADKYKHQQAFHSKKRQPEKITSTATYFQSPTSVSQNPLRSAHSFLNSFLDIGFGYPNAFCDSSCQASSQTAVKGTRQMCQKGQIAVYVGEIQKTRFVVSISYLNHPSFLDLLNRAEEEFGFNQPMGGLIIPCNEDVFIDITSRLHAR